MDVKVIRKILVTQIRHYYKFDKYEVNEKKQPSNMNFCMK